VPLITAATDHGCELHSFSLRAVQFSETKTTLLKLNKGNILAYRLWHGKLTIHSDD